MSPDLVCLCVARACLVCGCWWWVGGWVGGGSGCRGGVAVSGAAGGGWWAGWLGRGLGAPSVASTARVAARVWRGCSTPTRPRGWVSVVAPPSASSDGFGAGGLSVGVAGGSCAGVDAVVGFGSMTRRPRVGLLVGWVRAGLCPGVARSGSDTEFGVPLFCPRVVDPVCGDVESESYRITAATGDWDYAAGKRRSYTTRLDYDPTTGNLVGKTQRDWDWTPGCTGTKCKDEVHTETSYTLNPTAYSTTAHRAAPTHRPQRRSPSPTTPTATSPASSWPPTPPTRPCASSPGTPRTGSPASSTRPAGPAAPPPATPTTTPAPSPSTTPAAPLLRQPLGHLRQQHPDHPRVRRRRRLAARTGPDLTWLHHDGTGNTHLTTDTDGQHHPTT